MNDSCGQNSVSAVADLEVVDKDTTKAQGKECHTPTKTVSVEIVL